AEIRGALPDAFMRSRKSNASRSRTAQLTLWEVPGLNFPVKERQVLHRRNGGTEVSSFELRELRQKE
ncbi:MAG: hypothetical protein ACXWF2_15095, partial [Usitatibacter sp.]